MPACGRGSFDFAGRDFDLRDDEERGKLRGIFLQQPGKIASRREGDSRFEVCGDCLRGAQRFKGFQHFLPHSQEAVPILGARLVERVLEMLGGREIRHVHAGRRGTLAAADASRLPRR